MLSRSKRLTAVLSASVLLALTGSAAASAQGTWTEQGGGPAHGPATEAKDATDVPVYFVHGFGYDKDDEGNERYKGKDCVKTWKPAFDYFKKRGWSGKKLTTIGYYDEDKNCEEDINPSGENRATKNTKIQYIAQDLAAFIHKKHGDEPVNIVAHSMGGLITRVAMFGHERWGEDKFPKINVDQIVTLGTPHQGVGEDTDCLVARDKHERKDESTQWKQMAPGSDFLTTLARYNLKQKWAEKTDWSFAGTICQDTTVQANSAIDKGHHADHKYAYWNTNRPEVTHTGIRTLANADENPDGDKGDSDGDYNLTYWNASDGKKHRTKSGWSPLKTAAEAILRGKDA